MRAEREQEEREKIACERSLGRKKTRKRERERTKGSRQSLLRNEKRDVRTYVPTDGRRSRNPEWPPRPLSRLLTDKEESASERKRERRG